MQVTGYREKGLSYVVVDHYFPPKNLAEVRQELIDLRRLAGTPEHTNSALSEDGEILNKGHSFFIDGVYKKRRQFSPLLEANRRLFSEELILELVKHDQVFNFIDQSNRDDTLINYYYDKEAYAPHADTSRITAVTSLGVGGFKGGDFLFPDQGIEIPFKDNRCVIFPSCVKHGSSPVRTDSHSYRISVAQFVDFVSDGEWAI